jgi:tetratricopeptide (TPR) repeat protein
MSTVTTTAHCPQCNAAVEANHRFCPVCGCKLAPESPPLVPEPVTPNGTNEFAGFTDEEQYVAALARLQIMDIAQQQQAIQLAEDYFRHFPQGRYVFDVLLHGEVARAMHNTTAFNKTKRVDPQLYRVDDDLRFKAMYDNAPHEVAIRKLRTGMKFSHNADADMLAWARQNGITASPAEIDEVVDVFTQLLIHGEETVFDAIAAKVEQHYATFLMHDKTQAERDGIDEAEIAKRAKAAYRLYENGDFIRAEQSFRKLCELAPDYAYAHALLGVCRQKSGYWELALEEYLHALVLDSNDDNNRLNLLSCFRRFGLYGAADYISWHEKFAKTAEAKEPTGKKSTPEEDDLRIRIAVEETIAKSVMNGVMWVFARGILSSPETFENHLRAKKIIDQAAAELQRQKDEALELVKVFISYRRADAGATFERLLEQLSKRLGGAKIFRDTADIKAGSGWAETLEDEISKADVVLAFIGQHWTGADETNHRRLDDSADILRRELAFASKRNVPIIPVLLDGLSMPAADSLPSELKPLALTQGVGVAGPSFDEDVEKLVVQLRNLLKPINEKRREEFAILDEALLVKKGKVQFDFGVPFDSFCSSGKWVCKVNAPKIGLVGELHFQVTHNSNVTGTWSLAGLPVRNFQGNLKSQVEGDMLRGLIIEGLTSEIEKFHFEIPIKKKLGAGYEGEDESGGVYYLELVERYKEAL